MRDFCNYEDIIYKITKWCAYQERSEFQVRQKLQEWEVSDKDIEVILNYLKEENYVNEERFLQSYIHGKLSKKWGLEKIKHHLKQQHHISESKINEIIKNIEIDNYIDTLKQLILKKYQQLQEKEQDKMHLKKKIINFALSKGYNFQDIYSVLEELKF
ncbi:MAG: recombinase RecX [Bacteroidia bacterium]|nr:MAG: recombinase RecX [Bacteroidia bacterium]